MNIRKLEDYEEHVNENYPEKLDYLSGRLKERIWSKVKAGMKEEVVKEMKEKDIELAISDVTDYVEQIADLCYKEGYKDGYRFADWLHERTR